MRRDKIFVSYRRGDASGDARNVADRISARFGAKNVFIDIDAINPGRDFRDVIRENLRRTRVMVVLIGSEWSAGDRISHPNDFVRMEIREALESGIDVLPVLLNGAAMPAPDELPDDLESLAYRQSLWVNHQSFNNDMNALLEALCGNAPVLPSLGRWAAVGVLFLAVFGVGSVVAFRPDVVQPTWVWSPPDPPSGATSEVTSESSRQQDDVMAPPAFPTKADYRAAQTELRRLRLYDSGIDGDWGPGSRRAMAAFQRQSGIAPADGVLTEAGLASLRRAVAPPEPERQLRPQPVGCAARRSRIVSRPWRERFQDCAQCPEMVVIRRRRPSPWARRKTSQVGDSDEGPQRRVTISSRLPWARPRLPFAQWDACVSAGGCSHRPDDRGLGARLTASDQRPHGTTRRNMWAGCPARAARAIGCRRRRSGNMRRGRGRRALSVWGTDAYAGCHLCKWCDQVQPKSCNVRPIGGLRKNRLFGWVRQNQTATGGIVQPPTPLAFTTCIGNVWEWVQDCWHGSYLRRANRGWLRLDEDRHSGECSRAVLRGGSWVNNTRRICLPLR